MIIPARTKRTALLIGIAALLGLWIFVGAVIMPLRETSALLDRKIRAARQDLAKTGELADRYIALSAKLPPALKQDGPVGGPVSGDIESIAARLGANKFIQKITPATNPKTGRQDEVTATFEKIPYPLLIDFLQGVFDSSSGIGVLRGRITVNYDNRSNVNAEITFTKAF